MANVKINDLAVIADPASTDVLPIVDVTLDTTNKISIADILKTAPDGTAAAPAIAFEGDSNTGIYHPGSEQIGFATSGLGRLFIASDGNVGIGATDPSAPLSFGKSVYGEPGSEDFYRIKFNNLGGVTNDVGIGQSSGTNLDFNGQGGFRFLLGTSGEAARINSSGRLLVGTSSARTNFYNGNNTAQIQLEGTNFQNAAFAITCNANSPDKGGLIFAKSRGTAVGSNTVVQEDDDLGSIEFQGADGSQFVSGANIKAEVDGTPGANDMPSRLVFSTTADSAATPTARMTIDSDGLVGIGTTSPGKRLEVVETTNDTEVARFTNTGGISGSILGKGYVGFAVFQLANPGAYIGWDQNAPSGFQTEMTFGTRGNSDVFPSERMRIDSAGNVGIGTTSPGANLEVKSTEFSAITINTDRTSGNLGGITIASQGTQISQIYGTAGGDLNHLTSGAYTFCGSSVSNERARIDSSGRLLVGTSTALGTKTQGNVALTPIQQTAANTGAGSAQGLFFYGTSGASRANLIFSRSNSTTVGSHTVIGGAAQMGGIIFTGSDGTSFVPGAEIFAASDGTPGANDMPGRLVFATTADGASSPTERMRIDSAGNLAYGTDGQVINPAGGSLDGFSYQKSANQLVLSRNSGGSLILRRRSSDGVIQGFYRDTSLVGNISVTTSSTAYNTSSDYRLKENVVPLVNAADRVNQLQVHRFNFIADPDTTVDGFIAHEAQAVVPECVTGTKDEVDDEGNPVYQGIDQSKIVPLLTAALQEALAKIETLEQRLNDAGL